MAKQPKYTFTEKGPSIPTPKKTYTLWFIKQIAVTAGVALALWFVYSKSAGYHWVYASLLKGNYEIIQKFPHATFQEKMEMKLGPAASFLKFIKDKTPESAIILFPPPNDDCYNRTKQDFNLKPLENNTLASYGFVRFLWPRTGITANMKGHTSLFDKVTHVAIVNGWGFDYLNYEVSKPAYLGVYPIKNKQ